MHQKSTYAQRVEKISDMFGMDVQSAKKYVNVVPDHDLVPRIDEHYGVDFTRTEELLQVR